MNKKKKKENQIVESKPVYVNRDVEEIVQFMTPVSIAEVNEEGIIFSNGAMLSHYHESDCCESVYADWKYLIGEEFPNNITHIKIQIVPESGFRLILLTSDSEGDYTPYQFYVPCYNIQNGYYSNALALTIGIQGVVTLIDISEACYTDIV